MIGILGGTFDPPHNGHVALARAALQRLPVKRLLVLVASRPGHREVIADAQSRLDDVIYSIVRENLGRHTLREIMNEKRTEVMAEVTKESDAKARDYGIELD